MPKKRLFGVINVSSSEDTTKLAATVTGVLISCSALIVYGAALLGFTLVDGQVSAFATQAGLAVGALVTLYGVGRKLVNALSW